MSGTTLLILLLIVLPLVLTVLFVRGYKKLVTLRERYKNSFPQIDVQLQRRYDLIPNLVETAKGYLTHERETLEAVMTARTQAMAAEQRYAAAGRSTDDGFARTGRWHAIRQLRSGPALPRRSR
jgi:LemA protein